MKSKRKDTHATPPTHTQTHTHTDTGCRVHTKHHEGRRKQDFRDKVQSNLSVPDVKPFQKEHTHTHPPIHTHTQNGLMQEKEEQQGEASLELVDVPIQPDV